MQRFRLSALLLFVALLSLVPAYARAQQSARTGDEYTVRPGDVLRIRVWPDASMNGEYPVETSGMVNLPLVGELKVADLSLPDLRRLLTEHYGRAMKSPVISVIPVFSVGVVGAVSSPGEYQVLPTETVMDVLNRAGGFVKYAKTREIRIVRVNGRVEQFNGLEALTGKAAPLTLQSGDRIVVPEGSHFNLAAFAYGLQLAGTIVLLIRQFR